MDIVELQNNFTSACLIYALKNGEVLTNERDLFKAHYIENNNKSIKSNELIEITEWNHPSTKPTNEDLMKITIDEINEFNDEKEELKNISNFQIPKIRKFNCLEKINQNNQNKQGCCFVYVEDEQKLKVNINGKWFNIVLENEEKNNQ